MCLAAFMAGTTYSSSFENSMEIMNGQGWMEEKHRKLLGKEPPRFGTKWREVVYQREPAASSYKTDFGSYGDGVACQLPTHAFGFSSTASTSHLFKGTSKVCCHRNLCERVVEISIQLPAMHAGLGRLCMRLKRRARLA